ncbi:MAG: hypothetical protein K1W34_09700 [Lachnospiraceae bacterium]
MALTHEFSNIPVGFDGEPYLNVKKKITVPDEIIQYIGDSLQWVSSKWNNSKKKKGISYYGFSVIEGAEIRRLGGIVRGWKELFELAPEDFYLTGSFQPDEGRYEKNKINRQELMKILDSWIQLCETALEKGELILHEGI